MSHQPVASSSPIGRRQLLIAGGLGATTLVLAACGTSQAGTVGRIGEGAPNPELLPTIINDGVLLRTMAGVETSIADAYKRILDSGVLAQSSAAMPDIGDISDLVLLFHGSHLAAAVSFNELAVEAGEEAWECGNTRLDNAYINPIFTRVESGAPATDTSAAIDPSDDPTRDMINLVQALESLSASSCQALVPAVTAAPARVAAMAVGVRSSRQAALLALRINPGGYLPIAAAVDVPDEEPTTDTTATETTVDGPAVATPIPPPVAIPGRFSLLSPSQWVGGAGDENGLRLKVSFETPSENSLAYPFESCPPAS